MYSLRTYHRWTQIIPDLSAYASKPISLTALLVNLWMNKRMKRLSAIAGEILHIASPFPLICSVSLVLLIVALLSSFRGASSPICVSVRHVYPISVCLAGEDRFAQPYQVLPAADAQPPNPELPEWIGQGWGAHNGPPLDARLSARGPDAQSIRLRAGPPPPQLLEYARPNESAVGAGQQRGQRGESLRGKSLPLTYYSCT